MSSYSPEDLKKFEEEVVEAYLDKKIKAPIHLSDGNEEQLIEFFKRIRPSDWVFSTWRSHYHALLKGIPRDEVMQKILDGDSITLMFPEHKFITSAIVGGTSPIAVGTALGIKKSGKDEIVYCFIGDMTATTGVFRESLEYATNFDLPVVFIIEDNTQSVGTPTKITWGLEEQNPSTSMPEQIAPKLWKYNYFSKYPHVGAGQFVTF